MHTHATASKKLPRRRGFTLAELLMALSVSSIILVALAGATFAMSKAMTANRGAIEAQRTARNAMDQMVNAIRRCGYLTSSGVWASCDIAAVTNGTRAVGAWTTGTAIDFQRAKSPSDTKDPPMARFAMGTGSLAGKLIFIPDIATFSAANPATYAVLVDHVEKCEFSGYYTNAPLDIPNAAAGDVYPDRVNVSLKVTVENQPVSLNTSVAPRQTAANH